MTYTASRNQQELRSRAEAQLARLELPADIEVADIVEHVARVTGRRIEIEPVGDRDWENITGLVLLTSHSAKILVRKSDPRW